MFYVSELICVNNKSIFNIFEMYISYEQLVTCEKFELLIFLVITSHSWKLLAHLTFYVNAFIVLLIKDI